MKKYIKKVHAGKTSKGGPNNCQILPNNSEPKLPKGASNVVAGPRQNISHFSKFKNFNAKTCEENVKSAKRKFVSIEKETSTIESPSKRPNSETMSNGNLNPTGTSPRRGTNSSSDTSKAMPSSNPSTLHSDS